MIDLNSSIKKIGILGCGWYGFALAESLIAEGYEVKGSTTTVDKLTVLSDAKIMSYLVDFKTNTYHPDFFDVDLLIISIPPRIKINTLAGIETQFNAISSAATKNSVKNVILISSTGIFADENKMVNENDLPQPNTESGKALLLAEEILGKNQSFTTTIIRFAGLIGPGRNLAKHFAGRKAIPNGLAPINLIHLKDCIGITKAIIKRQAFGKIYHAVTPVHPTRAEFYTNACVIGGMEAPEFESELLDWKQVNSVNIGLLDYQFSVETTAQLIDLMIS